MMRPKTFPIWASLFTLIGVLILCSLSLWQVKRLNWKTDIIQKLDNAYANPADLLPTLAGEDKPEFSYGSIQGIIEADKALLLGPKTHDGLIGYHVIVPLKTNDSTILLNLGWSDKALSDIDLSLLSKQVQTYEGLARVPDWNSMTSPNSPENGLWFRADIAEIAREKMLHNVLPYVLYVTKTPLELISIKPHDKDWYPRNKHAQYALFWATMALCLIAIYALRFFKNKD